MIVDRRYPDMNLLSTPKIGEHSSFEIDMAGLFEDACRQFLGHCLHQLSSRYTAIDGNEGKFAKKYSTPRIDQTTGKYFVIVSDPNNGTVEQIEVSGATGLTDSTSGGLYLAPTPDANYRFRIYYNAVPVALSGSNTTTYLSNYMPQILLYACLVEAYGFLKGPMDMLTLYENKYKTGIQQFAGMQIGRRRRDDYTDGTVRIQVKSPSP